MPIILPSSRTKPETEELFLEVFRKAAADTTEEDVERLTAILREAGSLDFTLDRLHELARDIISGYHAHSQCCCHSLGPLTNNHGAWPVLMGHKS